MYKKNQKLPTFNSLKWNLDSEYINIDLSLSANDYLSEKREIIFNRIVSPIFRKTTELIWEQNGSDIAIDENEMTRILLDFQRLVVDNSIENDIVKMTFKQMDKLNTEDNNWRADYQISVPYFENNGLPLPSPNIIYTIQDDIIPTSANFAQNYSNTNKELLIASYNAFMRNMNMREDSLWVACTSSTYKIFQDNIVNIVNQNPTSISIDTQSNITASQSLKMKSDDLTSTWILPQEENDGVNPFSFERIVEASLFETIKNTKKFSPLMNSFSRYFNPKNIVFFNTEAMAKADVTKLKQHIAKTERNFELLKLNPQWLKLKQIAQLEEFSLEPIKRESKNANSQDDSETKKVATQLKASVKPLSVKQQIRYLKAVLKKSFTSGVTSNVGFKKKQTFMRANRRNPDDLNLQGTITNRFYKEDIHIYLDTSGSISEVNYISTIKALIGICKQLNVNLYFSSFSHILSQEVEIAVSDNSINAIYNQFRKIQKVTGGTNIDNVWDAIDVMDNKLAKKKVGKRINIIITDFEYDINRNRVFTKRNASSRCIYFPINTNKQSEYNQIKKAAQEFKVDLIQHGAKNPHFIM